LPIFDGPAVAGRLAAEEVATPVIQSAIDNMLEGYFSNLNLCSRHSSYQQPFQSTWRNVVGRGFSFIPAVL
jgi:hypothetical protein